MRQKSSKPKLSTPGPWSRREGPRGASVTAYERPDRGNTVWLRWGWNGGAPRQRATTLTLRDAEGLVEAAKEAQALVMLARAAAALARGEDPGDVLKKEEAPPKPVGELTLRQGFDRALDIESRKGYYTIAGEPWRQARTYSNDLCEILGETTLWRAITEDTAEEVWRAYADWHNSGATRTVKQGKAGKQTFKKGGHDTARRCVWWLYVVAKRVARLEGRIPPSPPPKQLERLATIWKQKTGKTTDPTAERFTDEEVAAMLKVLPQADPRVRLALGLALESRHGQAIRALRSQVDLSPGAGALGHGVLEILGDGKKDGTFIDFTPDMRREVDHALAPGGMLAALEAALKAGAITDYPFFPGGRLPSSGEARDTCDISWTSTGLRGAMIDLQNAAGVTIKPQRGAYGFRRWAADRAEDFESDERALNVITSHAHSRTRKGYQDPKHMGVRRLAANARGKIRSEPVKKAPSGAEPTPETTPSGA